VKVFNKPVTDKQRFQFISILVDSVNGQNGGGFKITELKVPL